MFNRFYLIILTILIVTHCNKTANIKAEKPDPVRASLVDPSPPLEKKQINFLVLGDSGTGGVEQYNVAKAMEKVCKKAKCDFAIILGDLIYEYGVDSVNDPQFKTKFEEPYKNLNFPFYLALGNNDYNGSVEAQIEYTKKSSKWRMLNRYFKIPILPDWLSLFIIDTQTIEDDPDQLAELKKGLCNQSKWKMFGGHHPIFSNGWHGDDEYIGEVLEPIIKECGVFAYLAGHDHHQEHINKNGYHQIIQGAAGKLRGVQKVEDPSQLFAESTYGFALVELSKSNFKMSFYNKKAKQIYSYQESK